MNIYWLNPPLSARSFYADIGWLNFSTVCKQYNWIQPIIDWELFKTVDDVVDYIINFNIDVLCISTYVWNHILCHEVAKRIKLLNPNICIIQGGPHQGFNNNFFIKHSYIDYLCYATGHGEEFLVGALEQIAKHGKIVDYDSIPFLITKDYTSSIKQSKYQYPIDSPLENNTEYLFDVISTAKQKHKSSSLLYDSTRGCPYACVYCEWGGGTGTKVSARPTEVVKKDIEIASMLGFDELDFVDANFGIFPRDIELINCIKENKEKYNYPKSFFYFGVPKVGVEKREKLLDAVLESGLVNYYFMALQTIEKESLDNAKRTDISLEENIKLAEKYRNKYNIPVKVELILGLPGNTLESFYKELDLFQKFDSWFWPRNIFNVLPDTEAADLLYQRLHKMVVVDAGVMENEEQDITFVSDSVISKFKSNTKIVVESYSFSKEDFKEMFFMNRAQRILGPLVPSDKLASIELKKQFNLIKSESWYTVIDQWLNKLVNGELQYQDINMIDSQVIEDIVKLNLGHNGLNNQTH